MIFALLTALCWTFGGYSGSRVARATDGATANGMRLALALLLWSLIVVLPVGWAWPMLSGALLFMLAGIAHQALGDNALYKGYQTIGPRLGVLFCITSSTVSALLLEKMILGGFPEWNQLLAIMIITGGTVIALAPTERLKLGPEAMRIGVSSAILGGVLQAFGAVASRGAYDQAVLPEGIASTITPTFLRSLGAVAGLMLIGRWSLKRWLSRLEKVERGRTFVILSAVLGPLVGVFFYQLALRELHSGLVQAIVGTLPLFMIPVAWIGDGDRPSRRSLLGAVIAVLGIAFLVLKV